MLKKVMKHVCALGAVMVLATPVAPAYAQYGNSGYELLYERFYFDDPEQQVQVGYEREECAYNGKVNGPIEGRVGPYTRDNVWAVCNNGQLEVYGG